MYNHNIVHLYNMPTKKQKNAKIRDSTYIQPAGWGLPHPAATGYFSAISAISAASDTNYDQNTRLGHFDRRATEWPEVEKPIKKQISRLRFAALEMTQKARSLSLIRITFRRADFGVLEGVFEEELADAGAEVAFVGAGL